MESHRKGDLTEATVLTELKRRDISVSLPFGDNERYDVVVETPGGWLFRAQVKTGWTRDGAVVFKGCSQHTNSEGNTYERYTDGIDCFLAYSHDVERLFLVWEEEAGTSMAIRVEEPEQRHRTANWADEYDFDSRWPPDNRRIRSVSGGRSPAVEPVGECLQERRIPFVQVENEPYHFLACDDSSTRHTCSGSVVDGRIRFPTEGSEAIDAYCIRCSEVDGIYLVRDEEFDRSVSLRVDPPDQADAFINWAADYRFDERWPP